MSQLSYRTYRTLQGLGSQVPYGTAQAPCPPGVTRDPRGLCPTKRLSSSDLSSLQQAEADAAAEANAAAGEEAIEVAPKPSPLDAYLRSQERLAELKAKLDLYKPRRRPIANPFATEPDPLPLAPVVIEAPLAPLPLRPESGNSDLLRLVGVGVVSGLAVWLLTGQKKG